MTTESAPQPSREDRLAPGTMMALIAMGLGVIVIANDFTALNVALPAIEHDFDVDVGTVQWVINAYALTFGMAIVAGGRFADMFGRRRIFFAGAALFAGFSLLGGLAPNSFFLIAMRVGMGIGAALMWPAILGMTYAALPESKAGLAGGLILGAAGVGNALGPMLGGLLTDELSWRWIFFLNVPIAAFAVMVTWAKVHPPRLPDAGERVDYAGISTLAASLLLFLLAFDQAADWGFGDVRVISMLGLAAVLLAGFCVIEPRRGLDALVPSDVLRNSDFRSACLAVLLMSAVFFSTVLYAPQFMEKLLGYSALKAGAGMAPMLATFAAVSFVAGPAYERLGAKLSVCLGALGLTIGPLLLSRVEASSGYGALVPGLVATGVGAGFFYSAVTTTAVTALAAARASLAGGLVYMFQIAGGAIGLGVTTTIFTITSEDDLAAKSRAAGARLTDQQVSVMHGVLAGTDASAGALARLSTSAQAKVVAFVDDSFVGGIQAGFRFVAIAAIVGLLVSILFVGGRPRLHRAAPADQRATG